MQKYGSFGHLFRIIGYFCKNTGIMSDALWNYWCCCTAKRLV